MHRRAHLNVTRTITAGLAAYLLTTGLLAQVDLEAKEGSRIELDRRVAEYSSFNGAVADVGDWDGDGLDDVAATVGSTTRSGRGGVLVFSPVSRAVFCAIAVPDGFLVHHAALLGLPDLDGDGKRDLLVQWHATILRDEQEKSRPTLVAYSTSRGRAIWELTAPDGGHWLQRRISPLRDFRGAAVSAVVPMFMNLPEQGIAYGLAHIDLRGGRIIRHVWLDELAAEGMYPGGIVSSPGHPKFHVLVIGVAHDGVGAAHLLDGFGLQSTSSIPLSRLVQPERLGINIPSSARGASVLCDAFGLRLSDGARQMSVGPPMQLQEFYSEQDGSLGVRSIGPIDSGIAGEADFGHAILQLDDCDGDGLPDYAVSAPRAGREGMVWVVSRATGQAIRTYEAVSCKRFGEDLVRIGNSAGDFANEWVIIANSPFYTGVVPGRIYVVDGRTLDVICDLAPGDLIW